jgi:hypothetical protein
MFEASIIFVLEDVAETINVLTSSLRSFIEKLTLFNVSLKQTSWFEIEEALSKKEA